jgi:hypothetical protein
VSRASEGNHARADGGIKRRLRPTEPLRPFPICPLPPIRAATSSLSLLFLQVFRAEPGKEDVVLRIAAAYEATSKRRIPPPAFGPL